MLVARLSSGRGSEIAELLSSWAWLGQSLMVGEHRAENQTVFQRRDHSGSHLISDQRDSPDRSAVAVIFEQIAVKLLKQVFGLLGKHLFVATDLAHTEGHGFS